ncbi:MAG: sulfite exporter TauE/SafE family protein [Deltaproteobacteria bacterium]|nr:sulfite exporter TauE/SafE family protein [Deltaproteobacteria bacterium]
MSPDLFVTLLALGGIGGFAAGLLGVGGGVVLFPLLLYAPPLLGLESFHVKTVAALVISQVFFASLIGGVAHWRSRRVHGRITLVASAAAVVGSFLGGVASKWVSEWFLLLLFGVVTLLAAAMMFFPRPSADQEDFPVERVVVPLIPLGILSGAKGIIVGLLGAGNFVFVPLMIYVLKVPTRIAIGSNLVIAVLTTFSGFLGKLITGQIPFLMALPVVLGACLGALGGEWSHGRVSPEGLRYIYAAVIGTVALRVWITLLS